MEKKYDNRPENLMVFDSQLSHMAFHKGYEAISNKDGTFKCNIKKPSKEELEILLNNHKGNRVIKDVAEETGLSDTTISNYCREYNINPNDYHPHMPTKEELIYLLEKHKGNFNAIGRDVKVSSSYISRLCEKYNLNSDDYRININPDKENLINLLKEFEGNYTNIANKIGISCSTVSRLCKRYNLNPDEYSNKINRDDLEKLLKEFNSNCTIIAKRLKVDPRTIFNWCRNYDLNLNDYKPTKMAKDELLYKLFINKYNMSALTRYLGISFWSVQHQIHDIYHIIIPTYDQLLYFLYKYNFNIFYTSLEFNVTDYIILDLCSKYNINLACYYNYIPTKEELINAWINSDFNINYVANYFGISNNMILDLNNKYGIKIACYIE